MPVQVACSPFKLIRNVRKKTFEITLLYVKYFVVSMTGIWSWVGRRKQDIANEHMITWRKANHAKIIA